MITLYLATDHAGFEHKEYLKNFLKSKEGITVIDCGAEHYDATDDYPEFISTAAREVSQDPFARAVIFGGSGQGEAMVANKFPNVRATVYYGHERDIIELSREHNDANILSIGARFVEPEEMTSVVERWLDLSFSGEERHVRRIEKISRIEASLYSFITKLRSRIK